MDTRRGPRSPWAPWHIWAVERSVDGIIAIDANGAISAMNRSAEAIFGIRAAEAIGLFMERFIPENLRERHRSHVETFRASRKDALEMDRRGRLRALTAAGHEFDADIAVVRAGPGDSAEFICFVRDVSQQRAVERELRFQAALLENSPAAALAVARSRRVVFWNRSAEQLFGWESREVLGSHICKIARHLSQQPDPHLICRSFLREGKWEGDVATTNRSGADIVVHLTVAPVADEAGGVLGAVCLAFDVTQERYLQEALLQSQKLESLAVLAGGVAHDFNNLLAAILGNAYLARQMAQSYAGIDELLGEISKATIRASELADHLLLYAGKRPTRREFVSLNEIVEEMVRLLRVSIPEGIRLTDRLESRVPPILADATQMRQVLMNLVLNAAEAIPAAPGTVQVSTRIVESDRRSWRGTPLAPADPVGSFVGIRVRDTGAGIDPDLRSRIFDPFATTKFSGRGLGLAAVMGIVRGHGGGIRLTSKPDRGTTVEVFLPLPGSSARSAHGDDEKADIA